MVELDVKFAKQMEVIIELFKFNQNAYKFKSSILGLVRAPEYKEYFEYVKLDKVLVKILLMGRFVINVNFIDDRVPSVTVSDPRSITRALFDNPKYLEFNRMKLIEHIKN